MAVHPVRIEDIPEEFKANYRYHLRKYTPIVENPPSDASESIPFFGKQIYKYQMARWLEAFYFFKKTGDPVIDQKFRNALMIRDYEVKAGLFYGAIWSGVFASMSGWKGFPIKARIAVCSVPFLLSAYRGFRRGYDQIMYVGETYAEHLLKTRDFLKKLRDRDDVVVEFKDHLVKTGKLQKYLKEFGLSQPISIAEPEEE